jgi:regulator of replication initiation timing
MKYLRFLAVLILTIGVVLAAYYSQTVTGDVKRLSTEINSLQGQVDRMVVQIGKVSRAKVDDAIVEELKSLTRENENWRQENCDLKKQLEAAGSFWKGGER